MSKVLSELKPQALWDIFESICEIPHPSKHEKKIGAFFMDFAKKHGLKAFQDKIGNVIVKKPATPGYEDRIGVILQGHMDMVPQKNSDSDHNFEKDPIIPRIEGNLVKATGTTLGADNGIGVAASLALMITPGIEHGPLECLITVDEETGMTGAENLEEGILDGKILINLDSEAHGELFVGCAGGMRTTSSKNYKEESLPDDMVCYELTVKGLKGGHSGVDIHLQRGNAIKIIGRILIDAEERFGIRLASLVGGTLQNAIPREAFSKVAVPIKYEDEFNSMIDEYQDKIRKELATVDGDLSIDVVAINKCKNVFEKDAQNKMLKAIKACPCGVYRMSDDMEGLVETSNNLATVTAENGHIKIENSQRSSVDSSREDITATIKAVFELAGFDVVLDSSYPGWKPDMNSLILKIVKEAFKKLFNEEPKIAAIHAGLECGLFKTVYTDWDMISMGPSINFPHSPDENIEIETVEYFWQLLVETLKQIPKK